MPRWPHPFSAVEALVLQWCQRLLALPPAPPTPALPPAEPSARLPAWQRELVAEAERAWGVASAEATERGEVAAAGPSRFVPPMLALPRAFFARRGYEPGKQPPDAQALRELLEAVYGPCLAPLAGHVLQNVALFGAVDAWVPGDGGNLVRAHVIFRELSALYGDALGFVPARLGFIGRIPKADTLGHYHDESREISLSSDLLAGPASRFVNIVVHEQTHHLQNLLVQRLVYAPGRLSPAERSLALSWYNQAPVDPATSFLFYRLSGRELHAWETAERVVRDLRPIFGWGGEVR